ncbi:MAG TPA: GNAT family N-acetyltransferase [Alphaproteobacteria bacterium]|nr:GNAT family N-acetyltransferase [Alphaproteobacteria bacterium]
MTALSIRRAAASDAAAVRDLTRTAYAKWCAVIGREPKPMTADYERAVREHLVDLAFTADRLVGLIEMIPGAEHLLVENVAVSPDSQGCGIGTRLMRHAEGVAIQLRLPVVRLYTSKLFAANVRLYKSLGYRLDREEAYKGGILIHMSKALGRR